MFNLFKSREEKIINLNKRHLKKLLNRLIKVVWNKYSPSILSEVPHPSTKYTTYFSKYHTLKTAIEGMLDYPYLIDDAIFRDTEAFINELELPHGYFRNSLNTIKNKKADEAVKKWKE